MSEQPCPSCLQTTEDRDRDLLERFCSWRNIDPEDMCPACSGSGTRVYASTSTWRGGIGGAAITSGVCDSCWGSGDKHKPWTNLRTMPGRLAGTEGAVEPAQEEVERVAKEMCGMWHNDARDWRNYDRWRRVARAVLSGAWRKP